MERSECFYVLLQRRSKNIKIVVYNIILTSYFTIVIAVNTWSVIFNRLETT